MADVETHKKLSTIVVAVFLFTMVIALPAVAQPQANTWTNAAPMPTNRWSFGTAVVNSKIYAIGGMADSGNGPIMLNTTEEFDPATNTWTTKQSMPFPSGPASRFPFAVTACNGKVYAFGFANISQPTMTTKVYNPQTDSWITKTPMTINANAETRAIANAVDGKIYVMGNAAEGFFNEAYDPSSDTWVSKAAPSNLQIPNTSCSFEGNIFVLDGEADDGNATKLQVYNTETDEWSVRAPLPTQMAFGSVTTATTGVKAPARIYVFGELPRTTSGSFMYDPATDNWMKFDALSESIEYFGVATANDQIYLMGGFIPPVISGYPEHTLVYTPFGYGGAPMPTPTQTPTSSSTTAPSATPNQPTSNLTTVAVIILVVIAVVVIAAVVMRKQTNHPSTNL